MADATVTKTKVSALSGPTFRGPAAGGTLIAGDVVYIDGSNGLKRASAEAAATAEVVGLLIAPQDMASGDDGSDLAAPGCLVGGFSGLTPGDLLYLSNTAGKLSTSPGTKLKVCARAIKADQIMWTLEGVDPA
jgi:hypothetical protein